MHTVFSSKHLISEITEQPLDDNEDQLVIASLTSNGVLTLIYAAKDETLRSRIALKLDSCRAVEAFADPSGKFFQLRADGSQVPLLLSQHECHQFMDAVGDILDKKL